MPELPLGEVSVCITTTIKSSNERKDHFNAVSRIPGLFSYAQRTKAPRKNKRNNIKVSKKK